MHVDTKCRNNINQFKTTRCWFWTLKYLRSRRTETYARRCICCIANKTCETYSDLITNAQLWRCGNPQKKWKWLPTDCKRPTLRARTERLQLKKNNLIWLLWNPPLWTHERFCKRYFFKNCVLQTMRRKCTQYSYRAPSSLHATVLVSAHVSGIIKLPNSIYGDATQNR